MLSITNIAKTKMKELINKNGQAIYLYLNSGGCNGFEYKFEILTENKKPHKLDEKINIDNEYDLYICNKSLLYVFGTEINYIDDIMGSRFDFKNNNITSKCGCGTSVNFK